MREKGIRYWKQKKTTVSVIAYLSRAAFFELQNKPFLGGRGSYKGLGPKPSEKDPSRAERTSLTEPHAFALNALLFSPAGFYPPHPASP